MRFLTVLILLLGLGWSGAAAQAQPANWERTIAILPNHNIIQFSRLVVDTVRQRITLQGLSQVVNTSPQQMPMLTAQYDWNGTQQWLQRAGRKLRLGSSDMHPWGAGGTLVVASQYTSVVSSSPTSVSAVALLQWRNAQGDTLRTTVVPQNRYDAIPGAFVRRGPAYYIAGSGLVPGGTSQASGQPQNTHFTLLKTDTLGQVQWARDYLNAVIPIPYPPGTTYDYMFTTDLVPRPNGRWLLYGDGPSPVGQACAFFLETDSLGRERRRAYILPYSNAYGYASNFYGNLVALRNGSGFVVGTTIKFDPYSSHGLVMKVDTALQLVWRALLPPQLTDNLHLSRVHEQADGTLLVLGWDEPSSSGRYSPTFHLFRLSAAGQLLSRRTFCSQVFNFNATVYDWSILPDGSLLVCGRANNLTGNVAAWLGRFYSDCPRFPAATAVSAALGTALVCWPIPAGAGAPLHVAWQRPAGGSPRAGLALRLLDGLGREVARQPLPAPGGETDLALPPGTAPGLYVLLLLADGQVVARQKVVVGGP